MYYSSTGQWMAQHAIDERGVSVVLACRAFAISASARKENILEALRPKKNVREITYIRYKYPTFFQSSDLV
jgi:hypothetical protein